MGDSLTLPCKVANLEPFVLMWKQGTRVFTAQSFVVRKDSRIKLRNEHDLEISNLRPEDQGTYTCEIDVHGKPISIEHTVRSRGFVTNEHLSCAKGPLTLSIANIIELACLVWP